MRKEERKALQGFMNRYEELNKERDRYFKELQEENKKVTGTAWCCAKSNMEDLKKAGVTWAESHYERYVQLGAKIDLLGEYGSMLAELGFWKNK